MNMNRSAAEILREYGPFPGVDNVHGVTYDGQQVWFASGDKLNASILRGARRCARSMLARTQERPSMASTGFRSPALASRRSMRSAGGWSGRCRRLAVV